MSSQQGRRSSTAAYRVARGTHRCGRDRRRPRQRHCTARSRAGPAEVARNRRGRQARRLSEIVSLNLFTIGVYGFDTEAFFSSLRDARITLLVDVRQRRGVRGHQYRFANATALIGELQRSGIPYRAEPRLAPTNEVRSIQRRADDDARVAKRNRDVLAPAFVHAYEDLVLSRYGDDALDALLDAAGERPCFLCVERLPSACHRGLISSWISKRTGSPVTDLLP
jgi:hypothetical protein